MKINEIKDFIEQIDTGINKNELHITKIIDNANAIHYDVDYRGFIVEKNSEILDSKIISAKLEAFAKLEEQLSYDGYELISFETITESSNIDYKIEIEDIDTGDLYENVQYSLNNKTSISDVYKILEKAILEINDDIELFADKQKSDTRGR